MKRLADVEVSEPKVVAVFDSFCVYINNYYINNAKQLLLCNIKTPKKLVSQLILYA